MCLCSLRGLVSFGLRAHHLVNVRCSVSKCCRRTYGSTENISLGIGINILEDAKHDAMINYTNSWTPSINGICIFLKTTFAS